MTRKIEFFSQNLGINMEYGQLNWLECIGLRETSQGDQTQVELMRGNSIFCVGGCSQTRKELKEPLIMGGGLFVDAYLSTEKKPLAKK